MTTEHDRLVAFVEKSSLAEAARTLAIPYPTLQKWIQRGPPLHALQTAQAWRRVQSLITLSHHKEKT